MPINQFPFNEIQKDCQKINNIINNYLYIKNITKLILAVYENWQYKFIDIK